MKKHNIIAGAGIGILLTPIPVILAILSGGMGHGHYVSARLFFPYTMLLTRVTGNTITLALIGLALVQLPLYGVLIASASSPASRAITVGSLFAIHLVAALICFSGVLPNFS